MILSDAEKRTLLELARRAVEAAVRGEKPPAAGGEAAGEGALAQRRGCFVTLTNGGRLRGCTGTLSANRPLASAIVAMAQAACDDPRFTHDPITPEELPALTVAVSVLSELELTRRPDELRVGEHGIYIVRGGRSGCFLPEVAPEQGWDATELLSYCCTHKAGLPANAWQDPDTRVYVFTSEKFEEP